MLMGTSDNPVTGSLRVRKRPEGVEVESAPPRHTFPRRFLERELNDAVEIHVILRSNPPVTYEVTSFSNADLNASLVPSAPKPDPVPEPAPEPKRRWWQRKNRG